MTDSSIPRSRNREHIRAVTDPGRFSGSWGRSQVLFQSIAEALPRLCQVPHVFATIANSLPLDAGVAGLHAAGDGNHMRLVVLGHQVVAQELIVEFSRHERRHVGRVKQRRERFRDRTA